MNFLDIINSLRLYFASLPHREPCRATTKNELQVWRRAADEVYNFVYDLPNNLKEIALGKRVGIPTLCRDIPEEWIAGRILEVVHGRKVEWRSSPGLKPYDEAFVRFIDSERGVVSQVWYKINGRDADMWYESSMESLRILNEREGRERFVIDVRRVLPEAPPPLPCGLVEVVEGNVYEDFVNQGLRQHEILRVNRTRFRVEFDMPRVESQQGWRHIDATDRFGRKLHKVVPLDWQQMFKNDDNYHKVQKKTEEYIKVYC